MPGLLIKVFPKIGNKPIAKIGGKEADADNALLKGAALAFGLKIVKKSTLVAIGELGSDKKGV
jgi:hypothetical protein